MMQIFLETCLKIREITSVKHNFRRVWAIWSHCGQAGKQALLIHEEKWGGGGGGIFSFRPLLKSERLRECDERTDRLP